MRCIGPSGHCEDAPALNKAMPEPSQKLGSTPIWIVSKKSEEPAVLKACGDARNARWPDLAAALTRAISSSRRLTLPAE